MATSTPVAFGGTARPELRAGAGPRPAVSQLIRGRVVNSTCREGVSYEEMDLSSQLTIPLTPRHPGVPNVPHTHTPVYPDSHPPGLVPAMCLVLDLARHAQWAVSSPPGPPCYQQCPGCPVGGFHPLAPEPYRALPGDICLPPAPRPPPPASCLGKLCLFPGALKSHPRRRPVHQAWLRGRPVTNRPGIPGQRTISDAFQDCWAVHYDTRLFHLSRCCLLTRSRGDAGAHE